MWRTLTVYREWPLWAWADVYVFRVRWSPTVSSRYEFGDSVDYFWYTRCGSVRTWRKKHTDWQKSWDDTKQTDINIVVFLCNLYDVLSGCIIFYYIFHRIVLLLNYSVYYIQYTADIQYNYIHNTLYINMF